MAWRTSAGWRSRVYDDVDEIAQLRQEWERVRAESGGGVFASHHVTMDWLRAFSDKVEPRFVALELRGRMEAVAPFVVPRRGMPGLRPLYLTGWTEGTLELYDRGVLSTRGAEAIPPLIDALGRMGWSSLRLGGLPDCPLHRSLVQMAGSAWPEAKVARTPCPCIDIPASDDITSLFGTRNRRTVRKLLRELGESGRMGFRELRAPDQVERAMLNYVDLHRERWAARGGSIFQDRGQREFLISLARGAAERGEGSTFELTIDGQLAAQALCLFDQRMARVYRISMNDALMEYSPGFLLFHDMLHVLRGRGVAMADLGAGGEEFKQRLGARESSLLGVRADRCHLRAASRLLGSPALSQLLRSSGLRDRVVCKRP